MLRFYRDAIADAARRPDGVRRARARPGRLGHEARGDGRLPHRRRRSRRSATWRRSRAWGSPLMVEVGPMPYPVMNTLLDAAYPNGALNYWLSSFTTGSARRADRRAGRAVRVGAVTDDRDPVRALPRRRDPGRPDATRRCPTATRAGTCSSRPCGLDPADTEANIAWTKDTYAALSEHFGGGRWLNYLGDDQDDASARRTARTTTGSSR